MRTQRPSRRGERPNPGRRSGSGGILRLLMIAAVARQAMRTRAEGPPAVTTPVDIDVAAVQAVPTAAAGPAVAAVAAVAAVDQEAKEPAERGGGDDLAKLARGSTASMFGVTVMAIAGFAYTVIVTRGLHARNAGVFLESIALVTILFTVAQLGSPTGLVRALPRLRSQKRTEDIRPTLIAAVVPVFAVSAVLGAIVFALAPWIADLVIHGANRQDAITYLRVLAPCIPLSSVSGAVVPATRGLGTMMGVVSVDNIGKPVSRAIISLLVVVGSLGAVSMALAWALPVPVGLAFAALLLMRRLRRAERKDGVTHPKPFRLERSTFFEFWRFTGVRAISTVFSVTVLYLDVLLIGGLRTSAQAGIYSAASRYVTAGTMFLTAILLVIGPQMSALLTEGETDRARSVYQTATTWLAVLSFPVYIAMAVFAPFLMSLFGPRFVSGATAMAILSLAMLVNMGTGPVMVVLLMGGKATWQLFNTMSGLISNVVLNVLLIPRYGMDGAAVAWAVSICVMNLVPVFQVWKLWRLQPIGSGFMQTTLASTMLFGVFGLAVREMFGTTAVAFIGYLAIALPLYLAIVWYYRSEIHIHAFSEMVRRRLRSA